MVPDNEAPGGERVKILDFGIAKFFGTAEGSAAPGEEPRHLTTVGKLLGTPVYMSPEQCSGSDQINDRVDVYALGVILYQMVSGRLPFEAAAACVVMTKHLMEQPPPLSEAAPDVPPEVATLVHEMLGKNGPERPPMTQVTTRLEQILSSQQGFGTGEWRSLHGQPLPKPRRAIRPAMWLAAAFVLCSSGLLSLGVYRRTHKPLPRPVATLAAPAVAPSPVVAPNPTTPPPAPTAALPPAPETQLAAVSAKKATGDGIDDGTRGRKRTAARPARKATGQPAGAGQTSGAPAASGAPDIPVFR